MAAHTSGAAVDVTAPFAHSMSLLTGGVAVVTTTVGGRPWGMTITACCSVTMSPPTVLISLAQNTATAHVIRETSSYGLCLMGVDGLETATYCAVSGRTKFLDDGEHEVACECRTPCAGGSIAHLDCVLTRTIDVGDHVIMLGEVRAICHPTVGAPLLYGSRAYQSVVPARHIAPGGDEHYALALSAW